MTAEVDISEMARAAIDYVVSGRSADALALLSDRFPTASDSDIARACRYALVISISQDEKDIAARLALVGAEARKREIASLVVDERE